MSCELHLDDWYNDKVDCPVPEELFFAGGLTNIVSIIVKEVSCFICGVLLWRKGRSASPLFTACAAWAASYVLLGPALTVRAFHFHRNFVLSEHKVKLLCWSFGLCFHWVGTNTYMLEVLLVTIMKYALVFEPLKAKRWVSRARSLKIAFTAYFGAVSLIMGFGLLFSSAPETRKHWIMFYFYAQALGCFGYASSVLGRAYLDVRRVSRDLPDFIPQDLRKRLRFIRYALIILVGEAVFICAGYATLASVPMFRKVAGYVFIYIIAPQGTLVLALAPAVHSWLICREKVSTPSESKVGSPKSVILSDDENSNDSPTVGSMTMSCNHSLEPVWHRGVSLKFLRQFASERNIEPDETTKDVCEAYVKPETEFARSSFWEQVHSVNRLQASLLGRPTCMVCHAWCYSFEMLISIIESYHDQMAEIEPEQYFFIDVFSLNQHDLAEVMGRPLEVAEGDERPEVERILQENLTRAVASAGRVLVALDPWEAPMALTRSWCLYETYVAHCEGVPLDVAFSQSTLAEFEAELGGVSFKLEALFDAVDVRNAKASVEEDQTMILGKIEEVGIDMFNDFIRSKLKSSLTLAAIARMNVSF